MKSGGLIKEDVAKKLCFTTNETFAFLGGKTRVQNKLKEHRHHFQWVSIILFIGVTLQFSLYLI